MKNENNNEICTYGIEKFEGDFEKETFGVTIIPNKSINEIRNPEALGLYVYLLARPHGWRLNVFQLKEHFQCNKDKIYHLLHYLMNCKFISKKEIRTKGKFIKHSYRVHLGRYGEHVNVVDCMVDKPIDQPKTQCQTGLSPLLEKPDLVKPDLVNPDAYKTKNIENKDYNKTPYVDFPKSTEMSFEYSQDEHFMKFYEIYPNKQKPRVAHRSFYKAAKKMGMDVPAFSQMVTEDVLLRLKNNWSGRAKNKYPFPQKYLNEAEWEGEIYAVERQENKQNEKFNASCDVNSYW
jgi:hypothetical protein